MSLVRTVSMGLVAMRGYTTSGRVFDDRFDTPETFVLESYATPEHVRTSHAVTHQPMMCDSPVHQNTIIHESICTTVRNMRKVRWCCHAIELMCGPG